jgi:uncharacterized RDD family membrane protein YckC
MSTEPGGGRPAGARRKGLVGNVIGRVAPTVMRSIDTEDLVDAIDVNLIAGELDLDALLERLDVDAVAARLDLDALVSRLDVDAVAARLDLDALVSRLDVDAVAARLDLDALVSRLDVDAIAARIDLNAVVGRLDMAQITAGASQDVAVSGLDLVRRQIIRADATVESLVDRTLLRRQVARPDAPTWVPLRSSGDIGRPGDAEDARPARKNVSGHYAGPVSRLLALAADTGAGLATFGLLTTVIRQLVGIFTPADVTFDPGGLVGAALGALWMLLWFWVPVSLFGRTPGMALLGLAVVCRDGSAVGRAAALVRTLVLPLSAIFLFLGFVGMLVGRERRALHDVAAGTIEVYDWGVREAQQPATTRQLLSARAPRVTTTQENA